MVGMLTYGNKKYESLDSVMRVTIGPLYDATQKMLPLIDKDTAAFNDYMVHSYTCVMYRMSCTCTSKILMLTVIMCIQTALKLPQASEEDKAKYVKLFKI